MQTNRYPGRCVDCKRHTAPSQGFLFGHYNALVCIECVYGDYAQRHGYLAARPQNSQTD